VTKFAHKWPIYQSNTSVITSICRRKESLLRFDSNSKYCITFWQYTGYIRSWNSGRSVKLHTQLHLSPCSCAPLQLMPFWEHRYKFTVSTATSRGTQLVTRWFPTTNISRSRWPRGYTVIPHNKHKPIPVAARSKASVCVCSVSGIAGSKPTEGMSGCLMWVLCVV